MDLATGGRLVTKNSSDIDAQSLLAQIASKYDHAKPAPRDGKTKKSCEVPTDIKLHSVPGHWRWVPLGSIVTYNESEKVASENIPNEAWVLDLEDIEKDSSRLLQRVTYQSRLSKSTKSRFQKSDVLYGKLRPYLNKVIVAAEPGFSTTEIVPIRCLLGIVPDYVKYVLKSPYFSKYVNAITYGVKMPRLGIADALRAPFPLPPTNEQHRIVAKVDQLMELCNELEHIEELLSKTRAKLSNSYTKWVLCEHLALSQLARASNG